MSKFLDRLKNGNMPTVLTAKTAFTPFDSFGSADSACIPENDTPAQPVDLHRLIGETLAEIYRLGRPWTGFHGALTPADRQQLREAEAAIDRAVLENDCDAAVKALDYYKSLLTALRSRLH